MGDREEKTVLFDESMLQQYQKNMTGKSSLVIVDGSGIQEYDLSKFVDGAYTFGRNENNSIRLIPALSQVIMASSICRKADAISATITARTVLILPMVRSLSRWHPISIMAAMAEI